MSYLEAPRFHFVGRFQADPSTVNNDPAHFTDEHDPNYSDPKIGWWNPYGSGAWRLRDCIVTRAVMSDGTVANSREEDQVIGMRLIDADSRPPAKIVDLDSQQQMASQIWGLLVQLGGQTSRVFSGEFVMAPFTDIWTRAPGAGFGAAGACWQSILTDVKWNGVQGSRFLASLKAASAEGRLSIKFNVDGYDGAGVGKSPTFGLGRICGTIGIYHETEPTRFVVGRHAAPVNGAPQVFNFFPTIVDHKRGKLVADIGNAIPTTKEGGPPVALPDLRFGYLDSNNTFTSVGRFDTSDPDWYANTAGVVEVPSDRTLSADEMTALATHPVALGLLVQGEVKTLAQEPLDGLYVRADQFVFRQSPGDSAVLELRALRFGLPLPNVVIALGLNPTLLQDPGDVLDPAVGTPTSALKVPAQVKTTHDGTVQVNVVCSDPAAGGLPPRGAIDGQVYAITYCLADVQKTTGTNFNRSDFVSLLIWNSYPLPSQPTWWEHIQPIFRQYAYLYPTMKPIVDLNDYESVVKHRCILVAALSLPMTDPNFMPVTRDLSPAKRDTILKWLGPPGSSTNPAEGLKPHAFSERANLARIKSGRSDQT